MKIKMKYVVKVAAQDGPSMTVGSFELERGVNLVRASLPEGTIESVEAKIYWELNAGEKIFMNGFQTWTHCPELTARDRLRGLKFAPRAAVRYFGLDRYGDHFFVDYPDKPGHSHGESWCYFRDGDIFRLLASVNERPGYTIFRYDAKKFTLTLIRDCAGIRCGGEYELFSLYCDEGSEQQVFDGWFAAMNVVPRTREKLAGYSSWYNRYQNISEEAILSDLQGCADVLAPGDLFQIDDGWECFVGDWFCDEKKFPGGMKKAVEEIHSRGFKAGLWLAPFICEKKSRIFREHPDWLYKHDGENWYCGCNWSGFYALDIDKPEVVSYLQDCFRRVFDEWGFDLVKLDFLYGGAPFGSATETRSARMMRGMELLRSLCGDKLLLGCGVPVMSAFGLADYCRISCDVALNWRGPLYMRLSNREYVSTVHAIHNSLFRRQLNGRAYLSDPDVFFLRDENLHLSEKQKYTLAAVNALMGGVFLTSDDMNRYDGEKKAQYAALLRLREATDVTVEADEGLSIEYTLDGVRQRLDIE